MKELGAISVIALISISTASQAYGLLTHEEQQQHNRQVELEQRYYEQQRQNTINEQRYRNLRFDVELQQQERDNEYRRNLNNQAGE